MSVEAATFPNRFHKAIDRLSALALSRRIAFWLTGITGFSCLVTYVMLARRSGNVDTIYWMLNLDLILLLMMGAVVARRVMHLWNKRKRGLAGSQLHTRFVFVFGILTAVPAILMAVFSSIFMYFGVHAWFNDRVSTAVHESLAVAQSYLKEHQQVMRADVLAMANDLNRESGELIDNPAAFNQVMQTQSMLRNLPEAIVFRADGEVLAKAKLSFSLEMEKVPERIMQEAKSGGVVLLTGDSHDRIRALIKLDRFLDAYLYVGRLVDAKVIQHMTKAESAVAEYTSLDGRKSQMQIATTLMFMAVVFLLLLAAVWFGFSFSEQMVSPLVALIIAAERVRGGDLSTRVPPAQSDDEIGLLGRAFNRMTSQLQSQQDELLAANRMLDDRRRFTEAVLSGASSGILGLDNKGVITLANVRAEMLLQGAAADEKTIIGKSLSGFIPTVVETLDKALSPDEKSASLQVEYAVGTGPRKTILIRITAEQGGSGAVATIDDISAVVAAQRNAAWADVARRVAHEIKNPLTPIQLSAERLKRKYLPQIQEDPETFARCTDTIIRQVNDIGHMVSEFSSYARMPVSVKKKEDIIEVCEDALILQQEAHPEVTFDFIAAEPAINAHFDRSQITQVMTNLLQNALDSIQERQQENPAPGRIKVIVEYKDDNILIAIEDNGTGLPEKVKDQVLEPYVTTKKKGSGLGLAIVKKIMEDHEGSIALEDSFQEGLKSGVKAVIVFPRGV